MARNPYQTQLDDLTKTAQFDPTTQAFDESKGVEARIGRISSSGSPLMEMAETRAKQAANERGLLNSSIAVGAGQSAVLDAALPIASADASMYQQQSLANQQAKNVASGQNAQMRGQIGSQGLSLMESSRQANQQAGLAREQMGQQQRQFESGQQQQQRQFDAGQRMQRTLAQMDADTRLKMMDVEAGYRTQIAGNENISNAWGTTQQAISQIQNNPELDAGTKAQLINNQLGSFQSFSKFWQKVTGGAVDVSDLLNFGVQSAGPSRENAPNVPAGPPAGAPPPQGAEQSPAWWSPNRNPYRTDDGA